jgi:hypothetical protein
MYTFRSAVSDADSFHFGEQQNCHLLGERHWVDSEAAMTGQHSGAGYCPIRSDCRLEEKYVLTTVLISKRSTENLFDYFFFPSRKVSPYWIALIPLRHPVTASPTTHHLTARAIKQVQQM